MKYLKYTLSAVCLIAASPTLAKKASEATGLELQQIQSRDVEASKDVAFSAVMSVLQDAGYRIGSADKETGLITGTASTTAKLSYNIFWGFGKNKKTPIVSAYIEPRGSNGARIRLNFVMAKVKGTIYTSGTQDEEPITDPSTYQQAFEKIDQAIFVRQSMDAPAPAVQATPPSTSATSTSAMGIPAVTPASATTPAK